MQDSEEIEQVYTEWRNKEYDELNKADLTDDARTSISNTGQTFYGDVDISAMKVLRTAKIQEADNSWVDAQNLALNNDTDPSIINPNTGAPFSPSELYEYATMKRAALGTVEYDTAQKDIRNFDQTVEYRQISMVARQNPDVAKERLDESSQSPQNRVLLEQTIQDAYERRDKKIKTVQEDTSRTLNSSLRGGTLDRMSVQTAMDAEETIMGETFPTLRKSEGDALMSYLNAEELGEEAKFAPQFEKIEDGWKKIIDKAEKGKFSEKDFDAVFKAIAASPKGSRKPSLSKGTIESQLNTAQYTMYKMAQGFRFNNTTTDSMNSIIDTFSTIQSDSPVHTDRHIHALNQKMQSFMKFVEDSGGNITEGQRDEWFEANMKNEIRDGAIIRARNTYRIGEPVVQEVDTGEAGPPIPMWGNLYRYLGNGEFERID
jgi:hypothetical protein